jgi:hypothetical protein
MTRAAPFAPGNPARPGPGRVVPTPFDVKIEGPEQEQFAVTETEWLTLEGPAPLLESVAGRAGERPLRLFLCACCARVLEGSAQWRDQSRRGRTFCMGVLRDALRTVERFADGACGPRDLEAAREAAADAVYVPASIDYGGESGLEYESAAVQGAAARPLSPASAYNACRRALEKIEQERGGRTLEGTSGIVKTLAETQRDMANWLRDVVGNPFRPVAVDPAWLSRNDCNVVRVADSVYASRDFRELPFLADALEDAGCADADILGHCRGPGPHVRGCWVLDLFSEAPRRFALRAASPEEEEGPPPAAAPPLRPGDWLCPACQAHNFARRDTCLRCQRPRPKPQLREGDWLCPVCHAHNFARRQTCHHCKGARPS